MRDPPAYLVGHQIDSSPCGYLSRADELDMRLETRAAQPLPPLRVACGDSVAVAPSDAAGCIERGRQLIASGVEIVTNRDMDDVRKYLAWERPWREFERRFVEWVNQGCPLIGETNG